MKVTFGLRIKLEDKTIYREYMTEVMAKEVKNLRSHGTWRFVAQEMADMFPKLPVYSGNQVAGMDLCESAAAFLGEDINSQEWDG